MIKSFEPIVNENTKILILGTIPGLASLKNREYYGNPRNHFWQLIYSFYNEEYSTIDFKDKIEFLLSHKLGLWDVLKNCERKGSLDIAIKNQTENDFDSFFKKHKNIEVIIFNGKESHRFFLKKYGQIQGITYHIMPSTSPANTMTFINKLNLWSTTLR
ncbi:MAG: DNA-deoxyinosine glycosylase [Bacteroidetes bacterium]|nr:DNA-deoxyinosine glycosylase [Bacteroidota bacterium]